MTLHVYLRLNGLRLSSARGLGAGTIKSGSPALNVLPAVLDREQDWMAVPMLWQRFLCCP